MRGPDARSQAVNALTAVVVALAVGRLAMAFVAGLTFTRGDFYAHMPGAHAEWMNPTLWASPDLGDLQGKTPIYLRGPTQQLTALPLLLLDSYASIARVLLVVYALVIVSVAAIGWRVACAARRAPTPAAPFLATTLLFFPLLQSYIGREFEVIITLAVATAFWAIATDRLGLLGGLIGYISFYKYLPLAAVPYLVVRRWWRGLAGFAIASIVILLLAQWLFGLQRFSGNDDLVDLAVRQFTGLTSSEVFCSGPSRLIRFEGSVQDVSVRFALCKMSQAAPISPALVYAVLVAVVLGLLAYGFLRLERLRPDPAAERWRRLFELSLVVVIWTTFFYAHYYYLAVLVAPFNVLVARFLDGGRAARPAMVTAVAAYVVLAAYLVPPSFVWRLTGIDVWSLYFESYSYFIGEMLLLGVLLREYTKIDARPA